MTQKHCSMCSGICEVKVLGSVSAEEGPLKLSFIGMPAQVCPKNHKSPVHRDFMLWLIHQLRELEPKLPAGREEGLLLKKHLCGACGKPLEAKPGRRQAFAFDLAFEQAPPFKAEIEMPMYKCSGCGKEQIRSAKDLHNRIPSAMVGVNDAAGFPHSG